MTRSRENSVSAEQTNWRREWDRDQPENYGCGACGAKFQLSGFLGE